MSEPFEDSRRLTGCNLYFAGSGAALESARGLDFDDAVVERWRNNVAAARAALDWAEGAVYVRRHASGVSLAFEAPMDQLYAAVEVDEWAWSSALAVSFSPREKVPAGRMRESQFRNESIGSTHLPFEPETLAFIRKLRRNATDAETLLWGFLRGRRMHGQKFRRQQALGPYVLDFHCYELNLAVELDGGQHNEDAGRSHDAQRDAYLSAKGVLVLRYWNHDVLAETEAVLVDIWNTVDALAKRSASGEGLPSSALRAPSPGGRREEQRPHAPGHAATWDDTLALHTLKRLARAEANPQLMALQHAADAHHVPLLPDDDAVSIGTGEASRTWPIDALPAPDAVDWPALHAIPAALVTGSNGKTTVVRLLAALLRAHGLHVAHSCTEGVYFDNALIEGGDFSGPGGARTVLRHRRAQAAVLETARGGLLRRGLALCRADVSIVTNISADHYGEYGVHDLDDLAAVKLVVARAVERDGLLVLNADDATLVRWAQDYAGTVGWCALDYDTPALATARGEDGVTCGVRAGELLCSLGGVEHALGPVAAMPLSLDSRAAYNIANLCAAALAALRMGVPRDTVARELARFGTDPADNPGRLQSWRFGDARVVVDYAHNPEGVHGLMRAVDAQHHRGRLTVLLGHAGNREDADLRAVAQAFADYRPARVVLKDIHGYERGRAPGEVAAIMRQALFDAGVDADAVETRLEEVDAALALLQDMRGDDLVVLPLHEIAAREAVVRVLDAMHARQWRPGAPLPEREGTP